MNQFCKIWLIGRGRERLYANRIDLGMIEDFEFSRNHWAVKEVNLYLFLLRNIRPRHQQPKVFRVPEHEDIDPFLILVMMLFDLKFDEVLESIRQVADNILMKCQRADDIWENPKVI